MPLALTDSVASTRLFLLCGQRVIRALVTDWKDLECDMGAYLQGTLTVTVPKTSTACIATNADGNSAQSIDWGWTDNSGKDNLWSLDFIYRGVRIFSGPIVVVKKTRDGYPGTAQVTLVAESFYQHFGRRRQVRTEDGSQWSATNDISDVFRQLWREQWKSGSVITPTGSGSRQAYTATEARTDAGPNWTVTVEADDSAGSSITYKVDDKTNLLDVTNELCNLTASTADWLWPTITESPAATWTIGVDVARPVLNDLTGSVLFTSHRGNLTRFEKVIDGSAAASLWTVTGRGSGTSQFCRHIADATACNVIGVYEDALNVAQGGTTGELDQEAQRLINEMKQGWVTWEAEVIETDETTYTADWNIGDNVTVYDATWAETVAAMVIGCKVAASTPGPFTVTPRFGRMPRHYLRELGRSGGGGGGGRGGGGRPRKKSGDPVQDPDAIYTYLTIAGDSGAPAVADVVNDTFTLTSDPAKAANEIHVLHVTGNDPETGSLKVRADMADGELVCLKYFEIQDVAGIWYQVPAKAKPLG